MRDAHRILGPAILVLVTNATSLSGQHDARLTLEDCVIPNSQAPARCGTYTVFENRAARSGRTIDLNVMVIPARSGDPRPDPVFYLTGGPGIGATRVARGMIFAWFGGDRDIVLVDQRGTGESNPLDCEFPGGADNLQPYLDREFQVEHFAPCREKLERVADLRFYTTPIAMDDLDEIRAALGYEKINLIGGSYGSRAALVYMRQHPRSVRTAILIGVAPIAFRNPLYHAREAQRALEKTFEQCGRDEACGAAFPNLEAEFRDVLDRFEAAPVSVTIPHPDTGEPVTLQLGRYAFAEALRTTMYYMPGAREVPFLIHKAYEGDYAFFATEGMEANRGIMTALQLGMLLSVTCPEDLARIEPDEIPALTEQTFYGDTRVRDQLAVCSIWPQGEVPDDYGEPVSVDVPTLVFSGTLDPVTSVYWGEETISHLPNSLHVVAPGAHGVGGPCIRIIQQQFLETASLDGLDTSCVQSMSLPPFRTQ
ncbi:MAG TPA: alpha/beta hydrolase [Gemmatimonadota bacterium]|nr:alpha/beta hydrolase [Gemmatimonadota bacterium]